MPHGELSNFLLKITFYLLSLWICMCVHKPQCMCGGQETTCWSQVFSSTLWVLGNRTQLWRQVSESFCWPQGFWFCFIKVSSLGSSSNLMPHLKFCVVFSLQRDAEGPEQCDPVHVKDLSLIPSTCIRWFIIVYNSSYTVSDTQSLCGHVNSQAHNVCRMQTYP